jgi:acetolactate synthase-1/2/3 large subunit
VKASDLLVRCFEAEGVRYVFGVPGEENADHRENLLLTERLGMIDETL